MFSNQTVKNKIMISQNAKNYTIRVPLLIQTLLKLSFILSPEIFVITAYIC